MLLFTMTGLMTKFANAFQWSFRLMEHPKYYMNITFIIIGAFGAIYWLSRQHIYNQKAEQNGTVK